MMKVKFQTKMTLAIILIILISTIITTGLSIKLILSKNEKELEKNLLDVGQIIAQTSLVYDELEKKEFKGDIQVLTNNLTNQIVGIDFIVVCDMNGIRYSHPNDKLIGTKMVGGDEAEVITQGEKYITQNEGTLGVSIRGFVPIFNESKEQMGYVVVGAMYKSFKEKQNEVWTMSAIFLVTGVLFGSIFGAILSKNTKKVLLGMEPEELAQLYREHGSVTEAIREGIVAVNHKGEVTLMNESARNLFDVKDNNIKGESVESVIPHTRLVGVIESGEAEYNMEQAINGKLIITNRIPIIEGEKVVGAVASFRDKTQLIHLGEELTGAKQMIQALRANNHEFSNKLQVIMGLLEMGQVDRAINYIVEIEEHKKSTLKYIMKNIKDEVISGLIIGKIYQCKEENIDLKMCDKSYLNKIDDNVICHSLVTIIGNLIDNALDSVKQDRNMNRWIKIFIYEDDTNIKIEVEDNGPGISENIKDHIFKRGVSTKGEERGTGLYLVKQAINNFKGHIYVDSIANESTKFTVIIPSNAKEEI